MARITKKLAQKIMDETNACYRQALLEEYPEFFSKYPNIDKLSDREMKIELHMVDLPFNSESINERYLSHVLKLSGDQLSLIVEADQKQRVRRSPVTIHAILDEMLHRSARGQYD